MGDSHRRAFADQQLRHRLADDVGATDHHRVEAGQVAKLALQQVRQPNGVHGTSEVQSGRQPPRIHRVEAVDVFGRIDVSMTRVESICFGSGSWTRIPSTGRRR